MANGPSKKRVFISYSREPAENAAFVRALAALLRFANFDVWLDEEQIPYGADIAEYINAGIQVSDAALFVVTSRWLERDRDFIRYEVQLVGTNNPRAKRLVLLREAATNTELGPYFSGQRRLEWYPDDTKPFARLWEIYCGITETGPGPRSEWEARGKSIFGSTLPPELQPTLATVTAVRPAPKQVDPPWGEIRLSCAGKPVAQFAGEEWAFLVTDRGEWVGVGADGRLHSSIPQISEFGAAIVTASNELMVAAHDATVALLRDGRWKVTKLDAPALALASGPNGELAGTAAGMVVPLQVRSVGAGFRIRDPVIALAPYDGGLLVLGSRGIFGRVSWPAASHDPLKWIAIGNLGRAVGFFPAVESNYVGLRSVTRLGVINPVTENLAVCPRTFEDGIRHIAFLGPQSWPYAVLTDAGAVILVDASLNSVRPVRFPRGVSAIGCCGTGWTGACLAWSADGRLYMVSPEGIAESIADRDIVMAYCPLGSENAHIIRWRPEQGGTVELLRIN